MVRPRRQTHIGDELNDRPRHLPAGGGIGQHQAGILMDVESVKALDEQVRRCTEAVLREGTDYGIIPGTNGEKSLWRPGAQKLLQWFRLECICERVDIERDDDGRKHGITYRAEVGRGLKTSAPVVLATCEGTADYDESKFHQDRRAGKGQAQGRRAQVGGERPPRPQRRPVEQRQGVPGGLERPDETRPETRHRRRRERRHRRRGDLHRPGRRRPHPRAAGRRPVLVRGRPWRSPATFTDIDDGRSAIRRGRGGPQVRPDLHGGSKTTSRTSSSSASSC